MLCVFCGGELSVIVVPPGSQTGYSCIPCAIEHGFYCEKHQCLHVGLEGGGSFCRQCVDESLASLMPEAKELVGSLLEALPQKEQGRIRYWANLVGTFAHDPSMPVTILRALIVGADLRALIVDADGQRVRIQDFIRALIAEQSATRLLPKFF